MNLIKQVSVAVIVAFTIGFSSSCQSAQVKNTQANLPENKAVANTSQTSANAPTPTASDKPVATNSPSETYKAACTARKTKDIATLKKLFAKDMLDFFTMLGNLEEKDKKTLDQMLLELCEKPQAPTAEIRDEKINGDKATAQYLDEKGGWSTMDFVREDGIWKMSIGKMDEDDNAGPPVKKPNSVKK